MSSAISVFRKRWPALAAIVVLLAVALATSTLFAANERRQPEPSTVSQQSVMDATDPVRAVEPPEAPPAPERVFFQPDDQQVEIEPPPVEKEPPQYPNLDANLNRLAEQAQAAQPAQQEANSADGTGGGASSSGEFVPPAEPVLVTFYVDPEQLAAVRQYLEDNDVFIRNVGEDYIEAHVPPALLPAASELPGVRRVDTVIPPQPDQSSGRVVSQGVTLHHADAWHRMGYRGQGVKVGVIDSGFEGFSQRQGSELPRNVTARCYPPFDSTEPVSSSLADCEVVSDHGTMVAEAVIDVAPAVQLYIANPSTGGDLLNAVGWMADNGIQVINYSQFFHYQGPGDGTSWFSNGRIKSVDEAVARGIVWVNSGGNRAKGTWHGPFSDPDGNNWHNYTLGDESNHFYLEFDEDDYEYVWVFMRWDDTWGGADCDLNLYLVKSGPDGPIDVDFDTAVQDGEADDIPRAIVFFEADSPNDEGNYHLFIQKKACADEPAWIQLGARIEGDNFQYYSPRYHVGNPAESRNPGMLAVGAAHWGSLQAIASYSSRGPTIDGRTKPDITGIACGRTSLRSSGVNDGTECWFSGTSQAAPHVAGLAALVRQRFPDYTPEQVTAYLKKHADDHERGPLGADNTWGHGLAVLPPGPEPTLRGSEPITDFDVRPGENPDEVVISWVPVPEATHYRIGYVNLEVDFHLATRASCTMERDDWLQAFVYVDVKAPNVPVKNGRAEYTIRRLSPGARHAFTVLASNNLYNNSLNVGAEFSWPKLGPQKLRWVRVAGRSDLPPGIPIPSLDCPQ